MIPPLFPAMIPSLAPACTATAMRGKLGWEFETYISYNAPMHFRHIHITSRDKKNCSLSIVLTAMDQKLQKS